MTRHVAPEPARFAPGGLPAKPGMGGLTGAGRFELAFRRDGAVTALGRQYVSYPFHMTRPFRLDAAIPTLLTVYQQSSSGGLYRGEQLSSRFRVGQEAAAHVTTQAATVVHDCHGVAARQVTDLAVEAGGFLALTPDPLVLFPGAACEAATEARLAPGSVLMLTEAFATHDPHVSRPRPGEGPARDDRAGRARPRTFDRLVSDISIRDPYGRLLVRDCQEIEGAALSGPASPLGCWRIAANVLMAGDAARLPALGTLAAIVAASSNSAVAGLTRLPNDAGLGLRCLAADAVAMRRLVETLFVEVVRAAFGHAPAPRRK